MKLGLRRAESGLTDDFIADAERLGHYPECSPPSVPVRDQRGCVASSARPPRQTTPGSARRRFGDRPPAHRADSGSSTGSRQVEARREGDGDHGVSLLLCAERNNGRPATGRRSRLTTGRATADTALGAHTLRSPRAQRAASGPLAAPESPSARRSLPLAATLAMIPMRAGCTGTTR